MSISYQPKDALVQELQLKVQELVLKSSDTIVSDDGTDTTINIKEEISYGAENGVKLALLCLDAGTVSKIAAADITYPQSYDNSVPPVATPTIPGGKEIKIAGVVLGADDVLVLKYSV